MRRYAIADLHFGHQNIIDYQNRPFNDWKNMNEKMIEWWNETVNENDIVYVLGDFTLSRSIRIIVNLLNRLKGKKVLIMGNHDTRKPKDYVECGFEYVSKKPIMIEPGIILMHEPFADLSLVVPNYIYFFGHVHAKETPMDTCSNCMCVSVERIGYKPIDLDKVIKNIKAKIK